jgi:hypothetical protein
VLLRTGLPAFQEGVVGLLEQGWTLLAQLLQGE